MKKIKYIILLISTISIFLIAIVILNINFKNKLYVPPLRIEGDVKKPYTIKSLNEFKLEKYSYKDKKYSGIRLEDILNKVELGYDKGKVFLVGDDGLTSSIDMKNLDGCYIAFTGKNGWEAMNLNHPISSNIKRIARICIVSDDAADYKVNIITKDQNISSQTPGKIMTNSHYSISYFEGKSTVNLKDSKNSVEVYTTYNALKLSEFTDIKDNVIVYGRNGQILKLPGSGYLDVKENSVNYTLMDKKNEVKNIAGILLNPPEISILNAYEDTLRTIKNGKKVMLIYVDGFGYHQYNRAVDEGYFKKPSGIVIDDMAWTVYTPVTNAGFAAMITGKTPEVNGIISRKQRELKCSSIFDELKSMDKKSVLIEGEIKILNIEAETLLNVDKNNNSTDDEVYECAVNRINKGYDFVLVHFHGLDDMGHTYGDFNEKTFEKVKEINGYINKLCEVWSGDVIITSDHGMHSTKDGGGHGELLYQDMIVPYIYIKGEGR